LVLISLYFSFLVAWQRKKPHTLKFLHQPRILQLKLLLARCPSLKLKQQVIAMANEDAKRRVDSARAEAEAESEKIGETGRANVANLKKNINSSFDAAVDNIVRTVLGDTTAAAAQKAAKPKK
jgi:hypothetical protein